MTVVSLFQKEHFSENISTTTADQLLDLTHQQNALLNIVYHFFEVKVDSNFLTEVFNVIFDNAFNHEQKVWYELRVVKELIHWAQTLGYDNIIDWHEHTYMLDDIFTNKANASEFLLKSKTIEVQSILLNRAAKIHPLFFKIFRQNIDSLIPDKIFKNISFCQIEASTPLLEHMVDSQSFQLLEKYNCNSWDEFEIIKRLS